MNKLRKTLERLSPPGANYRQPLHFLAGCVLFGSMLSLGYFTNYVQAYYEIFSRTTGMMISSGPMPTLEELLYLEPFSLMAFSFIAFVISNYLYFYQGSKSIYTMHRLRSPFQLHLRCWALPLLGAVTLLALALLLYCLYALHYFQATPAELIPVQNTIFGR